MRALTILAALSITISGAMLTALPLTTLAATRAKPLDITLAHGSDTERVVKEKLEALLQAYDVAPWIFTNAVRIDDRALPHSHPILTLHTRHRNDDELLLSTFLHEQLHWHVSRHREQADAAVADLKRAYPVIPVGFPEGSSDEAGNYYHLIVIWLEYRADRALLGELKARQVMEFWKDDHYTWLYATVLRDNRAIGAILRKHGLVPGATPTQAAQVRTPASQ